MDFQYSKRKRLVANRSFQLRNNDVKITIDRLANLQLPKTSLVVMTDTAMITGVGMIMTAKTKEMIVMAEIAVTGSFK